MNCTNCRDKGCAWCRPAANLNCPNCKGTGCPYCDIDRG